MNPGMASRPTVDHAVPKKQCPYCGEFADTLEREHVIPACLYPASKKRSKVQRLTIPACRRCNGSWADDEAHFRNVVLIAGEPNEAVREIWRTKAVPSFEKEDGRRRLVDIVSQLVPVQTPSGSSSMVYPGRDERVLRVVRKIVRGLCHHHGVLSPVPDHRVWVDVLKFGIPSDYVAMMAFHHREADIITYGYAVLNEVGIHSFWLLLFYERLPFVGLVSISEEGFDGLPSV